MEVINNAKELQVTNDVKKIETQEVKKKNYKEILKIMTKIHWHTVILETLVYTLGAVGFYQLMTGQWKFLTMPWTFFTYALGGIGQSIASHRLFSHRSFKANRGLKIFLIMCHTIAGQHTLFNWVKVHRTHHKFTDTEKDPTNINKGFWFSHIYWKWWFSPEVLKAMDSMDMSDLLADKDVMFQYKYYIPLQLAFVVLIPVLVPYFLWKEAFWVSVFANELRWLLNLNQMALANSLMHTSGAKPYDGRVSARENILAIIYTLGEGYHNYHHVFPWDYKAAEFGDVAHFNISAFIIDIFHKFGWATERKAVSKEMIEKRKARTGDGSHWLASENAFKNPTWGYGDVDMDIDDYMDIHAYFKDDFFKDK